MFKSRIDKLCVLLLWLNIVQDTSRTLDPVFQKHKGWKWPGQLIG
jgi:hypothetical protein